MASFYRTSPTPSSFASTISIPAPEGIEREAMVQQTAHIMAGLNKRDDGGADGTRTRPVRF
jgi:hypothetical protein